MKPSSTVEGIVPKPTYSKFDLIVIEWIPPLMFSILTLVIIYAVLRVTKMHFSRTTIQKLTPYPYYVILVYLATEAVQLLFIMKYIELILPEGASGDLHLYTNFLMPLIATFSTTKLLLYTVFVNV